LSSLKRKGAELNCPEVIELKALISDLTNKKSEEITRLKAENEQLRAQLSDLQFKHDHHFESLIQTTSSLMSESFDCFVYSLSTLRKAAVFEKYDMKEEMKNLISLVESKTGKKTGFQYLDYRVEFPEKPSIELVFTSYVEMNLILSRLINSFTLDERNDDQVSFFCTFYLYFFFNNFKSNSIIWPRRWVCSIQFLSKNKKYFYRRGVIKYILNPLFYGAKSRMRCTKILESI